MNMTQLDENFFVSGQIGFSDLESLSKSGVKSIICTRPDMEEGNQPLFDELAKEAEALGFQTLHVPIRPGQATADDVEKFANGFRKMPKPILGYCRSGARAHSLWQMGVQSAAK